jgi:hypothetical protein
LPHYTSNISYWWLEGEHANKSNPFVFTDIESDYM